MAMEMMDRKEGDVTAMVWCCAITVLQGAELPLAGTVYRIVYIYLVMHLSNDQTEHGSIR
jgi:hypothetical protein